MKTPTMDEDGESILRSSIVTMDHLHYPKAENYVDII